MHPQRDRQYAPNLRVVSGGTRRERLPLPVRDEGTRVFVFLLALILIGVAVGGVFLVKMAAGV